VTDEGIKEKTDTKTIITFSLSSWHQAVCIRDITT